LDCSRDKNKIKSIIATRHFADTNLFLSFHHCKFNFINALVLGKVIWSCLSKNFWRKRNNAMYILLYLLKQVLFLICIVVKDDFYDVSMDDVVVVFPMIV